MQEYRKNARKERESTNLQRIERIHPQKMLLFLVMTGSSFIFLFLLFSFVSRRPFSGNYFYFEFPKAFTISTIILILSAYPISRITAAFEADNMLKMRNYLIAAITAALLFIGFQATGWYYLDKFGVYLSGRTSGTYLYFISGLHVLHLIAGIGFAVYLLIISIKAAKDPVKGLILVTNPYKKMQVEMFKGFWIFISALWLFLFLFFFYIF